MPIWAASWLWGSPVTMGEVTYTPGSGGTGVDNLLIESGVSDNLLLESGPLDVLILE